MHAGLAVRVPLTNSSLTDAVFEVETATTAEEVNALMTAAAAGDLKDILQVRPPVSACISPKNSTPPPAIQKCGTCVLSESDQACASTRFGGGSCCCLLPGQLRAPGPFCSASLPAEASIHAFPVRKTPTFSDSGTTCRRGITTQKNLRRCVDSFTCRSFPL